MKKNEIKIKSKKIQINNTIIKYYEKTFIIDKKEIKYLSFNEDIKKENEILISIKKGII